MSDDAAVPHGSTVHRPRTPRGALVGPVVTIVVAVLLALAGLAGVWTRYLWFESVGYTSVLTRRAVTQTGLFLGTATLAALLVASSLVIAHRSRPLFVPGDGLPADRRQANLDPLRRLGLVLVPCALGVLAGVVAATQWQTFLLWLHRRPYGVVEPELGRDVGYYVFELPWWQLVTDLLLLVLALTTFVAAATHYVYGGLRIGPGARSTRAAVVHVCVLLFVLALLQAFRYWLDRQALAVADLGAVPGVTYTGAHALLPGKAILSAAAVVCALLFLVAARTGTWRLPVVGAALLAVCAVTVGSVYPALVQAFEVSRDVPAHEAAYAERAIVATRAAFGLDRMERAVLLGGGADAAHAAGLEAALLRPDELDRALTSPAKGSGGRTCASDEPLVVQAPPAGTAPRAGGPVVVAVCGAPAGGGWVAEHLRETHGTGVVVASAARYSEGSPLLLPSTVDRTPAYFGAGGADYVLVGGPGAPDGAQDGASATPSEPEGVAVDTPARRLAHAIDQRDVYLLTSSQVGAGSRIVEHRDPVDRVQRVAPWLTPDSHPYPVVVAGRLLWVVDGYTTTDSYPGSDHVDLADAVRDPSTADLPTATSMRRDTVSAMRNSVKATVDASDGTVRLYAWDDSDPLFEAWRDAFPGTVLPRSAMPAELVRSLRYPEDLFRVQRLLLQRYHTNDARAFVAGTAAWRLSSGTVQDTTAASATSARAVSPDPLATITARPIDAAPPEELVEGGRLSLTSTFTSSDRKQTAAVLVAQGPSGSSLGSLRLLEPHDPGLLPSPEVLASRLARVRGGPAEDLVARAAEAEATATRGPVTTVVAGRQALALQPILTTPKGGRDARTVGVLAVSDGRVGAGTTLEEALAAFEKDATEPLDAPASAVPGTGTSSATATPSPAPAMSLPEALARVRAAEDEVSRALRSGDRAAGESALVQLRDAVADVQRLSGSGSSGTPSPATQSKGASTPDSTATPPTTTGP